MTNGSVTTTIKNTIATINFHHPQSNSLPGNLLSDIADEIRQAGDNPDIKVIVLASEGTGAFCAGASFDELVAIDTFEKGKKFFSGFASVINAMREAPKFVIARVHGKAVGGGVGLACAADYAVATSAASVKLSELAVGIGPFVVGPAVERKIGKAAFQHLAINATEWQTAQWAKEKGMYAEITATTEELDAAVSKLAEKLAASSPEAMTALKKVFWEGTSHWNELLATRAEMSGQLVLSEFTRKAIEGFKAGVR